MGRRNWQIEDSPRLEPAFRPDSELKLLQEFHPSHGWDLEPGDVLYLPPGWAHDGVAEGDDCMTCSVGFRVPEATGLSRELLLRWADELEPPERPRLYRDPAQPATATPARIPDGLQTFAQEAISRLLTDPQGLMSALGEVLTEPKPSVVFQAGERPATWPPEPDQRAGARAGLGLGELVLDRRTRMMYDKHHIFINGESFRAGGADARLMRALADHRVLGAAQVQRASHDAQTLLQDWFEAGWLHLSPTD